MKKVFTLHLGDEEFVIPNEEWFNDLPNMIDKIKNKPAKRIWDLSNEQLVSLRKQISLGSMYYSDYENDLGINCAEAIDFFDGYIEYLWEEAEEQGLDDVDDLDTEYNLLNWAGCCEADEGERNYYKENYPQHEQSNDNEKLEFLEELLDVYDELGYDETIEWLYIVA